MNPYTRTAGNKRKQEERLMEVKRNYQVIRRFLISKSRDQELNEQKQVLTRKVLGKEEGSPKNWQQGTWGQKKWETGE